MKSTKNTTKVRKTNRKIAATVCAVIAATAMVTGIAVFTASAKTIEYKTSSLSSLISSTATVQQAAGTDTTKDNNNTKQDAPAAQKQTAPEAQQQAVPEAQKQAVPEVQQQVVPEVQQQTVPEVQQQATPEVQQQAAPVVKQQTAPAASQDNSQNKPLTIPKGEVNDWKTHDAKDGFPIGEFLDRSQSKHLFVTKLDDWRYSITVKVVTGEKTATVYNINAFANGNKMEYTDGTKCEVVYGDDLNIVQNNVVSSNHKGTFDASDAGYTWVDNTDGTTVFVPWVGYPYAK